MRRRIVAGISGAVPVPAVVRGIRSSRHGPAGQAGGRIFLRHRPQLESITGEKAALLEKRNPAIHGVTVDADMKNPAFAQAFFSAATVVF